MAEDTSKIKTLINNVRVELERIITEAEQEDITPEEKKEFAQEVESEFLNAQLELLDAFIKVIETYAKRYRFFDNLELTESREDWLHLLNYAKRMRRKEQLLKPRDIEDFRGTLMWMAIHGNEKELELIKEVRKNPPFNSDDIQRLFERVQQSIEARIFPAQKPKKLEIYQIFCSEAELREILPEVEIIESYEAFLFIEVDEKTIAQIKTRYPVEKLKSQSSQESIEDSGDHPMLKKEQIVKFKFPVREDWKKRIEDTNAKILQPLGNSEFVVSIPNEEILAQIKKFSEVSSVTPFEPTIRVQEEYLEGLGEEVTEEMLAEARLKLVENPQDVESSNIILGVLIASFFTEEDCNQAVKTLESQGIEIVEQPDINELIVDLINYSNPIDAYEIIKNLPGLTSIEEETIETTCNHVAVSLVAKGTSPINQIPGLTGKGEMIAIADTGLDLDIVNNSTLHPDFQGRVKAIKSYPIRLSESNRVHNPNDDDGASDKYSGHGTHVAGSALGNGKAAQRYGLPPIQGMAPEAELIFQAVEQSPQWRITEMFSFINRGRIPPASDLLGIPSNLKTLFEFAYTNGARIHSNSWEGGEYGSYNRRCRQLDEFVWQHKDFLIVFAAGNKGNQARTITPPGTAKNCITVGALAEFSSCGPCQNNRLKPDIIAPGSFILSTRSCQITHHSEAPYPLAKDCYMYMSGTSMATPLVAGSAALIRQYFRTQQGIENPSAALLKAALIHSAEYIPYCYAHESSTQWADNKQGWGRINLSRIINPPSPHQIVFFDQSEGLSESGQSHEYTVEITHNSIPLRVTLVYTDYPGKKLVNNLNLFVHSPTDQYYLGNDFNEEKQKDNFNNVEGCIIESPETGTWKIDIVGSNISQSPQDYALVISGAISNFQQVL